MSEAESARLMLAKALEDLRAISAMLDSEVFSDRIFGFHAQQAVEKSLKAWIAHVGAAFPYTHDISRLLTILEDHGVEVDRFWQLVDLNIYGVQLRYPSEEYHEGPLDRPETIDQVRDLAHLVRDIVEEGTGSL